MEPLFILLDQMVMIVGGFVANRSEMVADGLIEVKG